MTVDPAALDDQPEWSIGRRLAKATVIDPVTPLSITSPILSIHSSDNSTDGQYEKFESRQTGVGFPGRRKHPSQDLEPSSNGKSGLKQTTIFIEEKGIDFENIHSGNQKGKFLDRYLRYFSVKLSD